MQIDHIIIGAGRSGTTSLVEYLKQHPDVNFSSIKEVTYFSVEDHYQRGEQFLSSFFRPNASTTLHATSDTYLLMSKTAPQRILAHNPNVKLTVILREPSARTYSNYNFSVNHGYIPEEVSLLDSEKREADWFNSEDIIEQNNHCNFFGSLYHHHLSYWLKFFDKQQLFICTTSMLKDNPQELMNNYFHFLGLSEKTIKQLPPHHVAAGVKNKKLNRFLVDRNHWLRKLIRKPLQRGVLRRLLLESKIVDQLKEKNRKKMTYKPMSEKEKEFCQSYFKQDLNRLKKDFGITF